MVRYLFILSVVPIVLGLHPLYISKTLSQMQIVLKIQDIIK